MIYKIVEPAPHLKTFVKNYLILHFALDQNETEYIMPFPANTQHSLVFYLKGVVSAFDIKTKKVTTYPKIAIRGSQTSRIDIDLHVSKEYFIFSIDFQPSALFQFLRIPMTEFTNFRIDAESILNPEIHQVYEEMKNANSYDLLIEIAEKYLTMRIKRLKIDFQPIDELTQLINLNPSKYKVEQMASIACMSISQFERRFTNQLGVSPKLYDRINRFYQAYHIKERNPNADWLSIAIETGYHDYQHLVKDFNQFSGTSPRLFLEAQDHVPEIILGVS